MSQNSMLNLLFPQWQGAGNIALYRGAKRLHGAFADKDSFVEVPVASIRAER